MSKLSLPAGISVQRQGSTYVILKNGQGEIGGVVLEGTPYGNTQIRPYVNEPQDKNKGVVALIAQQMTDALLEHVAKKPEHLRSPVFPPEKNFPDDVILENKIFPCSRCNQITARLVFAWDCSSGEELETLGKKLELEASVSSYPIWILGAPDSDNDDTARHLTLQIAPVKGKVYWEHPDDMNKRLIELDDNHRCVLG